MSVQVKVFFTDGTDYTYTVRDVITAKRYAHKITQEGFRVKGRDRYIYKPASKIERVEVVGSEGEIHREELNEEKG